MLERGGAGSRGMNEIERRGLKDRGERGSASKRYAHASGRALMKAVNCCADSLMKTIIDQLFSRLLNYLLIFLPRSQCKSSHPPLFYRLKNLNGC